MIESGLLHFWCVNVILCIVIGSPVSTQSCMERLGQQLGSLEAMLLRLVAPKCTVLEKPLWGLFFKSLFFFEHMSSLFVSLSELSHFHSGKPVQYWTYTSPSPVTNFSISYNKNFLPGQRYYVYKIKDW